MKFFTLSFAVLFCFHFEGIQSGSLYDEDDILEEKDIVEEYSSTYEHKPSERTSTKTTTNYRRPTSSTPPSTTGKDSLDGVSIQDLLLSGIDGNEKIQKKIINDIKDFPSNFKNYRKPIILTTDGYSFPKKLIKYNLEKGHVIFRNIRVSQWYDSPNSQNSKFSYSIGCESRTSAKIRVDLPTNIKIEANISVTHPSIESMNEGTISIVIKNGTILKHVTASNDTNFDDVFPKIPYSNSKIDIQFEGGPQTLIYNKLATFFDEIEFSLREYFAQKLNEAIEERSLSVIFDCSKIRFAEPNAKKINLPYFNNFLNNLYVIPTVKLETWKGIALSAGPIVIEEFSFNSTELFVSREFMYDSDYGQGYRKEFTSRIKTGNLRGKFEWNYNLNNQDGGNSSFVFPFSIDNVLFENNFVAPPQSSWQQNMNVYLGETKIQSSVSNSTNIYEVNFAKFVVSEYLKSAIAESLKASLTEKIDSSQFSFVDTFFDN